MLQKPKGTYDIYGADAQRVLYLKKLINVLMEKYNYNYIQSPTFESSEVFHRGVGETTDIVSKETYDFKDRGERSLTLRPEGTAGIVRSFIENKLYTSSMPVKLWYYGSMFRYERPQAGRNREFSQYGVEVFGSESPMVDAEVISILVTLFRMLGLKGIKVNINSLGDSQSRMRYRDALVDYFKPYLDELCDDCKNRYSKNPLRMLDCKVDQDKEFMKSAPKISDYLTEESKKHFELVQKYLTAMDIDYVVDNNLVRGLDYYTHTVFEVEADIKGFGSQNVLGAGGRYNNLVELMEGPSTPGVGFAIGIERLLLALEAEDIDICEKNLVDIYVMNLSEDENEYMVNLVNYLRLNGYCVEMDYQGRNIKNNFKHADKISARFVIIVGPDEIKKDLITIKNNETKEEFKVKFDELLEFLDEKISED